MNRIGVDIFADLAGNIAFARQADDLRRESRIMNIGFDRPVKRGAESFVHAGCGAGADEVDRAQKQARRIGLRRLPAVEAVAVMCDKRDQLFPR